MRQLKGINEAKQLQGSGDRADPEDKLDDYAPDFDDDEDGDDGDGKGPPDGGSGVTGKKPEKRVSDAPPEKPPDDPGGDDQEEE